MSVSAASEASVLGDDQEESMEVLSRDLERLAIIPDSSLYQPSSSRNRRPMRASAKPRVHNTPNLDITLTKAKSQHCNGSWMSAVLGLLALL